MWLWVKNEIRTRNEGNALFVASNFPPLSTNLRFQMHGQSLRACVQLPVVLCSTVILCVACSPLSYCRGRWMEGKGGQDLIGYNLLGLTFVNTVSIDDHLLLVGINFLLKEIRCSSSVISFCN